jgi:hypothetical protein
MNFDNWQTHGSTMDKCFNNLKNKANVWWWRQGMVHENVSFTIIENEQYWIIHCSSKPKKILNLQPEVNYLGMTRFMQIILVITPYLIIELKKGDTIWVLILKLWTHLLPMIYIFFVDEMF